MERRTFLKSLVLSPILFRQATSQETTYNVRYAEPTINAFACLEISGSYYEIGYQIGKYFKRNIEMIIQRREKWYQNLLNILQSPEGQSRSSEYLRLTQKYFPNFMEEARGVADGSGIHFDAIWAMYIKSELGAMESEPEGCSTIAYRTKDRTWLFHNEDGNMAYDDLMFVVRVSPPSGVNFISLVYPGIITGNGPSINNRGIIQTTNYIGSTASEIGIPRYILGRAILEAKSLTEAIDFASMEPRAYPYHHNLGSLSENRYLSLETTPESWEIKEPGGLYCHTNHLLHEKTKDYPAEDMEYKQSSSMSRYQVVGEALQDFQEEPVTPDHFMEMLATHRNRPYSPCRHPEGDIHGLTLATAFFDFGAGIMRLYKGNPCLAGKLGKYSEYRF